MKFKYKFIERALKTLVKRLQDEIIIFFYRDEVLYLDDLMYY